MLRVTFIAALYATSAALVPGQSFDALFGAGDAVSLAGRRALVSGASSGIGKATACALAAAGCNLVLVSRRYERLAELKEEIVRRCDVSVDVVAGDVTDTALYEELEEKG